MVLKPPHELPVQGSSSRQHHDKILCSSRPVVSTIDSTVFSCLGKDTDHTSGKYEGGGETLHVADTKNPIYGYSKELSECSKDGGLIIETKKRNGSTSPNSILHSNTALRISSKLSSSPSFKVLSVSPLSKSKSQLQKYDFLWERKSVATPQCSTHDEYEFDSNWSLGFEEDADEEQQGCLGVFSEGEASPTQDGPRKAVSKEESESSVLEGGLEVGESVRSVRTSAPITIALPRALNVSKGGSQWSSSSGSSSSNGGCSEEDQSLMSSTSCPVVLSAMKGSRPRPAGLHVKWASDVWDPPRSSASHTVGSKLIRHQKQQPTSNRAKRRAEQKKQMKGKREAKARNVKKKSYSSLPSDRFFSKHVHASDNQIGFSVPTNLSSEEDGMCDKAQLSVGLSRLSIAEAKKEREIDNSWNTVSRKTNKKRADHRVTMI